MGKGPTESTYTHAHMYPDLRASKQSHAASVFPMWSFGELGGRQGRHVRTHRLECYAGNGAFREKERALIETSSLRDKI